MSQGEDRLPYLYEGECTRRDDPDNLGRIKVLIPGVVEPETPNWAWPMATPGGGAAQRGAYEPPAVGANVIVFFKLGERDYPYYFTGPWGEPAGQSDIPTNSAVEGADRQNAVTEDEEWRIERDSRAGGVKHLLRHRNSSLALLLDADADKVHLSREAAAEAFVRGTTYRSAEASALSTLATKLTAAGTQLDIAGTDPTLVSLASAAAAALKSAGAQLTSAGSTLSSDDMAADPTAYLSEKIFGD